jgi:hypothetical protein
MLHVKPDNRLLVGELNSVVAQPAAASAALKPEPVMETGVEDGPLNGASVILGVTAKFPVPKPPPAPVTWTAQVPPCAVVLTVKEAVSAPEESIAHVGEGAPEKRFDPAGALIEHGNPRSAVPKEPAGAVTVTAPVVVGPEGGEIVSVTGTPFVKPIEAISLVPAPLTVMLYKPLGTAALTVKVPTTVPLLTVGLTVQVAGKDGGVPNVGSKFAVTAPNVETMLWHVAVPPAAKPDPERETTVPAAPDIGDTAIRGIIMKAPAGVAAESCAGSPSTPSV